MVIAAAISEAWRPSSVAFFEENAHAERNLEHTRPPKTKSVRSRKTPLPGATR